MISICEMQLWDNIGIMVYTIVCNFLSIAALLVCINCINVEWSTKVQVVITTSKLAALVMIIIIGFIYIGKGLCSQFVTTFFEGRMIHLGGVGVGVIAFSAVFQLLLAAGDMSG